MSDPGQRFSRQTKPALPCCSLSKPRLAPVHTAEAMSATHKQSLRPDLKIACPRCHKDCISPAHSTGLSAARKPDGTHDRQLRTWHGRSRLCTAAPRGSHFRAPFKPTTAAIHSHRTNPRVQDISALRCSLDASRQQNAMPSPSQHQLKPACHIRSAQANRQNLPKSGRQAYVSLSFKADR